jgi:lysyl-tRNA synthetase class II
MRFKVLNFDKSGFFFDTQPMTQNPLNTSNIETQRRLRIEKMNKLLALGFDPFPVKSTRDYTIGFVKFWFQLIHKFDFSTIGADETNFLVEHYLYQAIFPPSLLETFEEKISMRHTARQMGIDPDDDIDTVETVYDEEILAEIRSLLPELSSKTREEKERLFYQLLVEKGETNASGEIEEAEGVEISLKPNQIVTLAGRIKTKRVSGKIAFAVIEDESSPEGLQFVFKKDTLDMTIEEKVREAFSPENIKQKLGL